MLFLRSPGSFLFRLAVRQFLALSFQLPQRLPRRNHPRRLRVQRSAVIRLHQVERAVELPPHQREALETLRLAPSASNRQPWRALVAGEQVHLYLRRTPGYHRAGGMDLQRLDIGIAMAHLELALRAADPGKAGRGRWEPPGPGEPADRGRRAREDRGASSFQNLEYMASWRTDD